MEQKPAIRQQTAQQVEKALQKPLTDVILTGKKLEINVALREYKTESGLVKYENVLSIPSEKRISQLAKNDYRQTSMVVTAAIHLSMEGMNLKRGMTADQEIDLAEAIIDTASEDNLALEDLLLFLQQLVRGEYGTTYESMDIPKFMNFFEKYRELRWQELNRIRLEKHNQHKITGDNGRNTKSDPLSEHFASMGDKLSEFKTRVDELKKENKDLKIKNF